MRLNNEQIGTRLGVTLPAGTRVVGFDSEAGIDSMFRAKLEMSGEQLETFIAGTNVARFEAGDADLLGPDRDYWDPHRAKKLRIGEVELPQARFLVVAIDDSQPTAVVYVMNHGT